MQTGHKIFGNEEAMCHSLCGAVFILWIVTYQHIVPSLAYGPGYLGCFIDDTSDRALETEKKECNQQSVEWCFKYCQDELPDEYIYAGLEYSDECFCGNTENYGRHGERPNDCKDRCDGNKKQFCGDSDRISVYRISQGVCSNEIGPPNNGTHAISPPVLPYHGDNLNNFKFFGTTVTFSCDSGFTLYGSQRIECVMDIGNNVTWSDAVPTCQAPTTTTLPASTTQPMTPIESTTSDDNTPSVDRTTTYCPDAACTSDAPLLTSSSAGATTVAMPAPNSQLTGTLQAGEIVGMVAGVLAAIAVLITVIFVWRKRGSMEKRSPAVAMDTMESNTYCNTDSAKDPDVTTEPNQSSRHLYCQVIKEKLTDDVYATPDDVTGPQDEQPNVDLIESSSNGQTKTEWAANTLYGSSPFPDELNASEIETPIACMNGDAGWVDNTIYE